MKDHLMHKDGWLRAYYQKIYIYDVLNIYLKITGLFFLFLLSLNPHLGCAQQVDSVEGDRQALMDLYEETGGNSWLNNSGWGSGDPFDSWHGVATDAEGRVIRLDLSGNDLSGSLPESIGNLSRLTYLNVKQNSLKGEIPWRDIGKLHNLTHLLLNGPSPEPNPAFTPHHPGKDTSGYMSDERTNNFTGSMGSQIGQLVRLEQLELMGVNSEYTGLTGPVPAEIGNLTNLEGLYLDYNSFDSLPESMRNLTNLLQFGMNNNGFSGSLPSWIENWTKLRYLWFEDNNFSAEIPDLSKLNDLRIFIAKKNNFTGNIPGYFFDGSMPHINMVDLAWNEFTGNLPEFSKSNNLAALQVDGNNLSGELPESIRNISSIINFGLGWNDLEGELPDLSHMHQLRYVRANDNNFTGTVPMVDISNKDLRFMHFHNNQMSGPIPLELAAIRNLPKFRNLNISNNRFAKADIQSLIDALRHSRGDSSYRSRINSLDDTDDLEILTYDGQSQ